MSKPGVSFSFYPFKTGSEEPHEVRMRAPDGQLVEVGRGVDDSAALKDLVQRLQARGESEYAAKVLGLFTAARPEGPS